MLQTLRDLWLSASGIKFYKDLLSKSQYWQADLMQEYQTLHLRDLLVTCYEDTEYYHQLLWQCDFDPYKDLLTTDDLSRIPLLTKKVARENHAALCNPRSLSDALELRTSGTTGDVFKEYVSRKHWVVEQGIVWRHWTWMGYRFRDKMAIVRSYVPRRGEPLWRLDRARNFLYFSAYHLTPENAEQYLRKMQEWKPKFLRGYPSSLYILAKMAATGNLEVPALDGILTASETLLPRYRKTIEDVFGARVYDWYGQAEITITMNECSAHQGLHINTDYGVCELVEDPALTASERRIVATCLHNEAMPLVRYDTGDIAVIAPAGPTPCACGHTLPLVSEIRGRSDDFLYGPDGRVIPSVNLYTMMDRYNELIAFQFIQKTPRQLEVRIKTRRKDATMESDCAKTSLIGLERV